MENQVLFKKYIRINNFINIQITLSNTPVNKVFFPVNVRSKKDTEKKIIHVVIVFFPDNDFKSINKNSYSQILLR